MSTITITLPTQIKVEDLFYCLQCPGISYWAQFYPIAEEDLKNLCEGGTSKWKFSEFDEATGEPTHEHVLDHQALRRGLQVMAEKNPSRFADLVSGNFDIETGDFLLQYALLGRIVYG